MKTTNNLIGIWHVLGVMFVSISLGNAQEEAPFPTPPRNVSSIATLASEEEPGEPLVITGTVYRADGKTPFAGLALYFYQTDLSGVYNRTTGSWKNPRLHGWIRTDSEGRYQLKTIKPGSYPTGRNPAHIHVTVQLSGTRAQWLDSYLFEEDPYLTDSDRKQASVGGYFSPVLKLRRSSDGILRGRRNIAIAPPR